MRSFPLLPIQLTILLLSLLLSTWVRGDEGYSPPPIEDIPPGEDRIVPLAKGQLAPFAGQLFETDTAIRWGNWLQQYRYRLRVDVSLATAVCREEVGYQAALLEIERIRAVKVEKDLQERLLRAETARIAAESTEPAWYATRTFGVVLGVLATTGILAMSIWALEARRE